MITNPLPYEPLSEHEKALTERCRIATRALRTGVKIRTAVDEREADPERLRCEMDLQDAEMVGLLRLLIKKGVLTRRELFEAVADSLEDAVASSGDDLTRHFGSKVTLI